MWRNFTINSDKKSGYQNQIDRDIFSKIRLFVSDLDGTMLDSDGRMHQDNIPAVEYLRSKSIKFSVATGRMMTAALTPLEGLSLDYPIITLNGCLVSHPEILHIPVPDDALYRLFPLFDGLEATIVSLKKDSAFITGHSHIEMRALSNWVSNIDPVGKLEHEHLKCTTVLLVTGSEEVITDFHNHSKEILGDDADIFTFPSIRYKPLWYSEVRAKNVNKGESLRLLREYHGLQKDEVLIVGDYHNDIELFEEAGFAVAPANALDEVKAKADFVSSYTNDQAVIVDIINRFFGE